MAENDKTITILPLSRVDDVGDSSAPVSSAVQDRFSFQASQVAPQLLERVRSPIILLDEQCRILLANLALRRLLGLESSGLLGYSAHRFLTEAKLLEACQRVRAGEQAVQYRDEIFVDSLLLEVEISVDQLEVGGRHYICLNLSDQTDEERVRAEWEQNEEHPTEPPAEQLQKAHQLEVLGQMSGSLAHDFNNLLSIILGSLQSAERRLHDEKDVGADIQRALSATQRSIRLTSQVLRYMRNQGSAAQAIDPGTILFEIRNLIERTLGDAISLSVETKSTSTIHVEPAQFEAAILNLVINSRDALHEGGEVKITTSPRQLDASSALQLGLVEGNYVSIQLCDTGEGMPEEIQERVFEPFYTTKADGTGTGLGLSSVRSLLSRLGGTALIRSSSSAGTTIELLFPALS